MTPDPIEQIARELVRKHVHLGRLTEPAHELEDAIAAALRQQREAGQQEARQQVGEGLFTAKYLNPGCAEKGCQFLQREPQLPELRRAVEASTARLYPDANYERYLDEIVSSTIGVLEDINDEHGAACIRQLTEALHALRRSRDELRTDAARIALAIRESQEALRAEAQPEQEKP